MAKAKQFNITNFVEEAATGVQVAEEQRRKEASLKHKEETNELGQPQIQPNVNVREELPPSRVVSEESRVVMPEPTKVDEPQKGKRGRKKSLRTIERVNGKIIFLEKSMDADLARLSTFERFDKQDIIRTALFQWLKVHFDGMMLDNDGRREVIEYIQRTTTFEDI